MKIGARERGEVRVPTDSLSDVAFLLIIFFILTTSLRQITGVKADLPAAERGAPQQVEKTPTVQLRGEELRFNDQLMDLATFRDRLRELDLPSRPREEDRIVVVETSGRVSYQRYFETLAAISGAGGIVGLLTEEEGERSP